MNKVLLQLALLGATTSAFVHNHASLKRRVHCETETTFLPRTTSSVSSSALFVSPEDQTRTDDEIEMLKSKAAQLRAEVSMMEAERAKELADAAESAFRKFDLNQDGEISLGELKAGLEKVLKTELPEKRVEKLMQDFDRNNNGVLELEEFVGLDQFRNRLQALAAEEKRAAMEAEKAAKMEAEMAKLMEAKLEMINEKTPTGLDRFVSVLPYLFPLMDSLQFGRFLVLENVDNPFVLILGILFTLYRSVPFSGLIAFVALNVLSNNLSINRLVRFNMQQAIFVDIFLLFPGLTGAMIGILTQGTKLPPGIVELSNDAVFLVTFLTIAYCSVVSLLGKTPDQIPLISNAVKQRMPTIDMFDEQGRLVSPTKEDDKKD